MVRTTRFYDIHPAATGKDQLLWDVIRYLLLFCSGGFAVLFTSLQSWSLPTIEELLSNNEQLEIVMNKSTLVRLKQPVERVSIVATEIADVQVLDRKQILVTALSVGETSLILWMEDQSVRTIDVVVRVNTRPIKEAIQHSMPDQGIEVLPLSNGIALRGQVDGSVVADQAMDIAHSYSCQVVNLLQVPGVQQVMLKVKVAEVARQVEEEFGVNFQVLDNDIQGTTVLGDLVSGTLNESGLSVSDAVTMFLGLPNSNINAFIQALQENGLLHVLAEPNLVARSGETASFLAGGEFPVPILQGGALTNAITIIYKEFGVRLKFTPTVLDSQTIRLDIAPEVSDLDFAQGIRMGGFLIPTIITRRAKTVVSLKDGQTFAIAGLMSKSKQKTRRKIPVVGDLPLFGGIFKGGNITEKETELLIMVTPHLVMPLTDGESYAMPGHSIEQAESSPFAEKQTISQGMESSKNAQPNRPVYEIKKRIEPRKALSKPSRHRTFKTKSRR